MSLRASLRILAAIGFVVVLHLVLTGAERESGRARDGMPVVAARHIVPAHAGHLREIAIQFHRDGGERFLPVFEGIFGALAADTHVWVVVSDDDDCARFERARASWEGADIEVRYVMTGHAITSWARDRFAVLADEAPEAGSVDGPITLLAPPKPMMGPEARARDWLVPWALRRELGARGRVRTAPFAFEGGDLIADEAHVFVASALFGRNRDTTPSALLHAVADATGRPAVRLGDDAHPSPDHHIGMFVTPLGGGRVAYADVARGLAAIGDAASVVADGTALAVDRSDETRARFDRVREDLTRQGFEAIPLPLVPTTERYVYFGFDNVILDARADGLHVLLPVYGVPALDDAATRAWREDVGAIVHPIPVHTIFRLGGTVRCVVAPLRRG